MNIFFDIETVPAQDPQVRADIASSITAPAQYKKPESIAEWLRENRESEAESAWLKTSFDGGSGQVVCVSWATDDSDARTLVVNDLTRKSEASLLDVLFSDWTKLHANSGLRPVLIGHNHVGFDIPFVWKRAMVHGIKPPLWFPRNPKPWSDSVIDTMHLWDPTQRAGGSMDRICRLLGIPGKGDVSGADVWPMAQAGRFSEIAEYCGDDVKRTREMYRRMTFA
jgi:predicted PolB exonuclease-like 3'-5' exonuclease